MPYVLQVLDNIHQLFSEPNSPFITLLAVDPHVVIKGIEQNLQVSQATSRELRSKLKRAQSLRLQARDRCLLEKHCSGRVIRTMSTRTRAVFQGLFSGSSINGHDYLRNIVSLPFFTSLALDVFGHGPQQIELPVMRTVLALLTIVVLPKVTSMDPNSLVDLARGPTKL